MKTPCIMLWNRVFERYEIFAQNGARLHADTFEYAVNTIEKSVCLTEVPVNSKIGRQILAQIGVKR